ncbi:MAG: endopeptidase La [Gammaproteobacteria bacterium]
MIERSVFPVLPLRDVVVYPHMVIPLFVGRQKSVRALEQAMDRDKQILLVAQKAAADDNPGPQDIYPFGTISSILQMLKLPDGTIKVLVEGGRRAAIRGFVETGEVFTAQVELPHAEPIDAREAEVLCRSVLDRFEQYLKLNRKIPPEVLASLGGIDDPERLADTIAAHLAVKLDQKQKLLELAGVRERLEQLLVMLESELDLLQVEKRLRGRVKRQMEKSQREYYLNEQMKAIQKELGDLEEGGGELDEIARSIERAGMPKEARERAYAELKKLKMMSPMAAEATVVRNYIDWMLNVPWKKRTKVSHDLAKAEAILEADHYGLKKVKERILEYLAVQQRVKKSKGPILCLAGPPGVGKTSLGRSIARATNRKFIRMSLGGVRDEAEIRGHRRTYVGSMPGKILQVMAKSGTKNPLLLLDEIDKISTDFRGDPAAALLEVLDPEQNHTFNDHYLEVDYDLSEVMFVTTANTLNISPPLLDRMEVIRLPGYTEDEKVNIAQRYLIPKQTGENGLKPEELCVNEAAIRAIIRYYTREAGVRNLEREIANICRKVVKAVLLKPTEKTVAITPRKVGRYLGVKRFRYGLADAEDRIGQVTGLAWTEVGGDLLTVEVAVVPGKGKETYTGQLGDVMQESIKAAMTVVRSRAAALGIDPGFYRKLDVHFHVPEGATPKDGPSAGVAMCTALVSALSGVPVRSTVAMTGEITLRGEILPIGGLKEKLLAALRGGIKTVLIPGENQRELEEVPKNIKQHLDIHPVTWIEQVLGVALQRMPEPLVEKAEPLEPGAPEAETGHDPLRHHH